VIKAKDIIVPFPKGKGRGGKNPAPLLFPFLFRRRFDTTEEMDIVLRSSGGRYRSLYIGTGPKSSYKGS
jgi:hypothetical protein